MAKKRIYICPDHPEKPYTSWRRFRGHWSTLHKGEECPPRENFLQEVEAEDVPQMKQEYREELEAGGGISKHDESGSNYGRDIPRVGVEGLPEEPIARLATILDVHGIDKSIRDSVLSIFQLHPAYKDNPVNLQYLLMAKLPRKHHQIIPMMVSEFTMQEGATLEGAALGMLQPGLNSNMMPSYLYPGMSQGYYQPSFGYQNYGMRPMAGAVPPGGGYPGYGSEGPVASGRGGEGDISPGEERKNNLQEVKEIVELVLASHYKSGDEEAPKSKKEDLKETIAVIGSVMGLVREMTPQSDKAEESNAKMGEYLQDLRSTLEKVIAESAAERAALREEMNNTVRELMEQNRTTLTEMKDQLSEAEKRRLQDRIDSLEETKDEERTEGLGGLLREAGMGLGTQMSGVKDSIDKVVDKIGDVAVTLPKVVPPQIPVEAPKTLEQAGQLFEAELQVEALARSLEKEAST